MATAFAPDYPQEVPRIRQSGFDVCEETSRWDNEEIYDPDPESWRYYKSYCASEKLLREAF